MGIECLLIDLDETLAKYKKKECVKAVALRSLNPAWIAAAYTNNYKILPSKLKTIHDKGLHNNDIHKGVSRWLSKVFSKARKSLSLDSVEKNPELRQSLIEARDAGLKLYVVTKSPKDRAIKVLKHLGIDDLFTGKVMHVSGKEYYDTYKSFIVRNEPDLNVSNVALLDDTVVNIEAAQHAELKTTHVNNDKYSIDKVIRDYVLEKMAYNASVDLDM